MSNKNDTNSRAATLLRASEIFEEKGDMRLSFACLLAGAQFGHSSCQLNLGNLYASGTGTRKNPKRAAYWYKKAHANGNLSGAFNLALELQRRDKLRSSVSWLKKAVAMKHGRAHMMLAKIYSKDPKTLTRAIKLVQQLLELSSDEVSADERKDAEMSLAKLLKRSGRSALLR